MSARPAAAEWSVSEVDCFPHVRPVLSNSCNLHSVPSAAADVVLSVCEERPRDSALGCSLVVVLQQLGVVPQLDRDSAFHVQLRAQSLDGLGFIASFEEGGKRD